MLRRVVLQGVELPDLRARLGVEGHDPERSGGDVHHALDDDRRAFDRLPLAALEFAGVISPGRLEPMDVLPIDLIERRISHAAGVVPDPGPIDRRGGLRLHLSGQREEAPEAHQCRTHRGSPIGRIGVERRRRAGRGEAPSGRGRHVLSIPAPLRRTRVSHCSSRSSGWRPTAHGTREEAPVYPGGHRSGTDSGSDRSPGPTGRLPSPTQGRQ